MADNEGQLGPNGTYNQPVPADDLAAIRARDAHWVDKRPMQESAGRDRRALLDYIDELESIMVEVAADVKIIRRRHREHYLAKMADPALLDMLDAELAAERAENGRQGLANFRESKTPDKLPP